jgi:hypothetical protein
MAMPNAITDIASSRTAPNRRGRFPELLTLTLMRPDSEKRLVPGIVSSLFHTEFRFILNRRRVKHILALGPAMKANALQNLLKKLPHAKGAKDAKELM